MSVIALDEFGTSEFPVEEYSLRWTRAAARIRELGASAMIVDEAENVRYLSGYMPTATRYQCLVLTAEGTIFAVVRELDEPAFSEQSPVGRHLTFQDWEDPEQQVARALELLGCPGGAVLVEGDSHFLSVSRLARLQAAMRDSYDLVPFEGLVRELRVTKSEAELALLRRCAGIADGIVEAVARASTPGRSERELAAAAYTRGLTDGADNGRMLLLASGSRSHIFHGSLGDHKLLPGDVVHAEAVPQLKGYSSRIMRPIVSGSASAAQRELAKMLVDIQDVQIASMRDGACAADVDRLCREPVLSSGVRKTYTNATAYTLGLHGVPRTTDFTRALMPNSEWLLQAGMVFHVYTSAHGMAFSETVLVTKDGGERLTRTPRTIIESDEYAGGVSGGH